MKTISQIATVVAKAVAQAIFVERGDGDLLTRCSGQEAGVRPMLGGPAPSYTFTNEVKNIYHNCNVTKAETFMLLKIH